MSLRCTPSRAASDWPSAAVDEGEPSMRPQEYLQILAKRVLFSRLHSFLCATVIAAGVVEVLWILLPTTDSGIGHPPDHWLFQIAESYVTLGLVGEIVLRLALEGWHTFFAKRANQFDLVVAGLSGLSSLLYALRLESPAEMAAAEVMVLVRVVFRLLRLVTVTKGMRRHQQAAGRKLELEVRLDEDAETGLLTQPTSPVSPGDSGSGSGEGSTTPGSGAYLTPVCTPPRGACLRPTAAMQQTAYCTACSTVGGGGAVGACDDFV